MVSMPATTDKQPSTRPRSGPKSGRTLERAQRQSQGDRQIYAELHDAILEQRLAPGAKLTEDVLGEIFGVSRTLVRKALIKLAHENLVEMRPNRGAVVASPSVEEAADVFEARRVIEGAIIRKLCPNLSRERVAHLSDLVDRERAAHQSNDRAAWIRLSGAFHLELAEMAGNKVLANGLMELVSRTSLIISLYERPGSSVCSFDEHGDLIEALAAGDADAAVALMNAHLASCERKLDIDSDQSSLDLTAIFGARANGT